DLVEALLAALVQAVEPHAHARRHAWPPGVVLARPHHSALAGDERRGIAELELESHLRADRQRLLGADEDAAVADVHRVALDELLERRALELDLERDRCALALTCVGINQGGPPSQETRARMRLPGERQRVDSINVRSMRPPNATRTGALLAAAARTAVLAVGFIATARAATDPPLITRSGVVASANPVASQVGADVLGR